MQNTQLAIVSQKSHETTWMIQFMDLVTTQNETCSLQSGMRPPIMSANVHIYHESEANT